MRETLDLLSDFAEIMAYVLTMVLAFGFIITGGDAISFERTVVLMLLNVGAVALE